MSDATKFAREAALRQVFQLGALEVDTLAGAVRGPAGREQLDPKVMAVFVALVQRANQVVSREELLGTVWPGLVVTDDALSRCIYQLRRHLQRAGGSDRYKEWLETLPKRGYRLNCSPGTDTRAHTSEPPSEHALPADQRNTDAQNRPEMPGARRRSRAWLLSVAVAVLITLGTTSWFLNRLDYFWRDPFATARFTRLTDFEGAEQEAAISRDGKLVAFLSDRDGPFDVWFGEIDSGQFRNLTRGQVSDIRNSAVRTLAFTPDGADVILWKRVAGSAAIPAPIDLLAAPTAGGPLRSYRDGAAEIAWSPDGTRMIYRTPDSGDPMFVTEAGQTVGRRIFVAPLGLHCHFPLWSPDGAYIYYTYGLAPDEMDIWRIAPTGGQPERITFHNSRVAYPAFIDERTLLYLASEQDGSGPWLYGINVDRRVAHRIGFGLEPYTSLAATHDGSRLVATVTTERTSLWRVSISDRVAEQSAASRVELPALGGRSPRFGTDHLLYLSPTGGLWKLAAGVPQELWNARQGRVVAGAAVEPQGNRIAFPVSVGNRTRLHLANGDGTGVRVLAEALDVRGAPAWSPDGGSIVIAADRGSGPQLFRIPVDGAQAVPITDEFSIDPVWSPDGRFLVYRGGELGPSFRVQAVTIAGEPYGVPNLMLPRGAGRFGFSAPGTLSSGTGLVILKGELKHKDFWLVDLDTGDERQLTNFGPEFVIGDFDVRVDGSEIIFDRAREQSDVVMIEL